MFGNKRREARMAVVRKITWGIGRKLAFAFAGLVTLTIIVGTAALVGIQAVQRSMDQAVNVTGQMAGLANQVNHDLLEARRMEGDYFLHYKEVGLETARNEYVAAVQQYVGAVHQYAAKMRSLGSDEELLARANQIDTLIDEYEAGFLKLVDLIEKRGVGDSALEGELNDATYELGKDVTTATELPNKDALMVLLLTLRRHEKDYMLYGASQYVEDVHGRAAQLRLQLAASGLEDSVPLVDGYVAAFDAVVALDSEIASTLENLRVTAESIVPLADEVAAAAQNEQTQSLASVVRMARGILVAVFAGMFVSVVLGSTVATVMGRSIAGPIRSLNGAARSVAGGDLEVQAHVRSNDETGVLADVFNQMIGSLREMLRNEREQREYLETTVRRYVEFASAVGQGSLSTRLALDGHGRPEDDPLTVLGRQLNEMTASMQGMLGQIRDAAGELGSAGTEILAATTQQASGANEQSAAIAQTTTTVDEVKVIAEQSMKRSQEVAGISERTVRIARAGQQAVQETIASMAQIKERVEGIAENILALSEQTQQIGEIIATVNDIAAQSNMLALNASVEAARAGEHGKGFSVVAVEVRNLAEQSRQATAQVKAILSDIQRATNASVMATEEGTKGVDVGVQLAGETREAIGRLSAAIEESAQAALQMVAGGQQQASGIEQIALAMANINQATVQSLASTRQAEQTAQNLNELAHSLNQIVELAQ
jgi:methyl-accepting chemotaxis protein